MNPNLPDKISIGFIFDSSNGSQVSYSFLKGINQYLYEHIDVDIIIYTDEPGHTYFTPLCPILHMNELMGHVGPTIFTSLETAEIGLHFINRDKQYFYIPDVTFVNDKIPKDFVSQIIKHPNLKLISRCDTHQEILKQIFDVDSYVMQEDILECIPELIRLVKNEHKYIT